MKKSTKLLLAAIFSFAAITFYSIYKFKPGVSSQIIESSSIQDVKKFIEPGTLFVFDYDQVLVQGKIDYGFDAWFCAAFAELEKRGLSREEAKRKLLPIYWQIQLTSEVKLVEEGAKTLIDDLKRSGHNVMILTVRSRCLADSVFRQLQSIGIDVKRDAIFEDGINSALDKVGAKYVDGILFCDGYYKGDALKTFLQGKPDLKVKNIVFIDDKLKNVESVKAAAQEMGINFVGIRYGRTDERVKAYKLDERSLMLVDSLANKDKEPRVLQQSPSVA
jgi:phosphoglycolate phosphatase-like HAD superfamily hydrolase